VLPNEKSNIKFPNLYPNLRLRKEYRYAYDA